VVVAILVAAVVADVLVADSLVLVPFGPADFEALVHPAATMATSTTILTTLPLITRQGWHNDP
jgi:hypothetical protein